MGQDATVATAKLIASAPPAAIKNVFDTVPQVQTLNGDWFATMPVADAVKSYQAFFGDSRRSEALSAGGAAVKGPATGPPFVLWFFFLTAGRQPLGACLSARSRAPRNVFM